jgi:hypothetical protein
VYCARACHAALPTAMRRTASSARACRVSRRPGRPVGSCCGASARVFATAGSQVRASGSGFGSGRYPSCCGRAMTVSSSARVVSACTLRRGGQGWPEAIAARCSRSMARSTAARSVSS